MYAVIQAGGRQVRVEIGDVVRVDRRVENEGDPVVFDRVLMVVDGDSSRVGSPTLEGVQVKATVLEHGRGEKILTYKSKRRQNSNRRRQGHRQGFTAVKIEAIEA